MVGFARVARTRRCLRAWLASDGWFFVPFLETTDRSRPSFVRINYGAPLHCVPTLRPNVYSIPALCAFFVIESIGRRGISVL
jgi:hypothetical protein